MKPTMLDITEGLDKLAYINVGDNVKNMEDDHGEVIGFSADGKPVVLFDRAGEQVVDETKDQLIVTGVRDYRPGVALQKKSVSRVPLKHANDVGFTHLVADRYMYEPTEKQAIRYPWDKGSIWKIQSDKDGTKYLIKEEDEVGFDDINNKGNSPASQLDNDNSENSTVPAEFNIKESPSH